MMSLDFFDCNCQVGMRGIVNPGSFYRIEDLAAKMPFYGIKKALVYHSMAREYHPQVGNSILIDEIKAYPELYPVWVLMPHHTMEFPKPQDLIGQMKTNGVKAVRMFPESWEQNYSISEWNCGELLSTLEKHRIPLMIGLDQLGWDKVHEICSNHSGLRLILTEVDYRIDRNLYPLLNKFSNLYLETIGYKVHNGIEEICRRFGADRLIFGSNMPVIAGSAAVSMINYACISEAEKRMIAYENLEQLLGGVLL